MTSADELRRLQAPLRERYRNPPEFALVTLHAAGNVGAGLTCSVETGAMPSAVATDEEVATLLRLTERYGVVLQAMANPPALSASHTRRQ